MGHRVVPQGELWLPRRELRHSLPAERDPFIGRRDELAELARRFADGAHYLPPFEEVRAMRKD
mgnify:CR=1 FL=1